MKFQISDKPSRVISTEKRLKECPKEPGVRGPKVCFDKFIEDLDTKLVLGACLFGITFRRTHKTQLRTLYVMSFYETFTQSEMVNEWNISRLTIRKMVSCGLVEKKVVVKTQSYFYLSAQAREFVMQQNAESIALLKKLTKIKHRYTKPYFKVGGLQTVQLPLGRKNPPRIGDYSLHKPRNYRKSDGNK